MTCINSRKDFDEFDRIQRSSRIPICIKNSGEMIAAASVLDARRLGDVDSNEDDMVKWRSTPKDHESR